ncbi:MAG: hypothetical protein FWC11_03100 [Firmicutes bacterium]|nr:hypothetical protein [Bacillota bacterium]
MSNRITYRDCVRQAAINLQLDDVITALQGTSNNFGGASADVVGEIERLTNCAKMTAIEIASDYIPLTREEETRSQNQRVRLSSLMERVSSVVAVRQGTQNVNFSLSHDEILLPFDGVFSVVYNFIPPFGNPNLSEQIPWNHAKVNERTLSFGIACEYCILMGMFDEALLWDKRFKDALFKANIEKAEKKIKRRRWL